jgi:hypothetical protein
MPALQNIKILFMATGGFEQSELEVPSDKRKAAGERQRPMPPFRQI